MWSRCVNGINEFTLCRFLPEYLFLFVPSPSLPLLQILSVHCDMRTLEGEKHELQLRLTFEDKMDRELTSELKEGLCVKIVIITLKLQLHM